MDILTLERPVVANAPQFTISKNIPLPPRTRGSGRTSIYPFGQMAVGDSFEVPAGTTARNGGKRTPEAVRAIIYNCARTYAKKYNPSAKFATRVLGLSVRIWRVA